MLLFVLSATPLINLIEEVRKIRGFQTKYNNKIKLLAYADDTTIIVRDAESIAKTFEAYHSYARPQKPN